LDFLPFDGEDPAGWIYKIEQYFPLNQILEDLKVHMATFHLDHEALQWNQWYSKTHPNPSWDEFTQKLLIHFGSSEYEDFKGALTKLHQTTTVKENQN